MIFFYHYENLPRRYEDDVMQMNYEYAVDSMYSGHDFKTWCQVVQKKLSQRGYKRRMREDLAASMARYCR